MDFKIASIVLCESSTSWKRCIIILVGALMLSGCDPFLLNLRPIHYIDINPQATANPPENVLSTKVAGYVMSDLYRGKMFTTNGGCGETVSYYPYRDLEQAIKDALRTLYSDVVLVSSPSDFETFKLHGVGIVFATEISTSSSSDSTLYWPPTYFYLELFSTVTDAKGNFLTQVRVTGQGEAPMPERHGNSGLSGKRAAQDALAKFTAEIRANPSLR